jgi:hypothetical protein
MTVSWNAAAKTARMNVGLAQIDANAAPAILEIGTTNMAAVLATLTLSKPSFTQAGDILTMAGVPKSVMGSGTGQAAAARIKDGGGVIVISGLTVGTLGADINLDSVSIISGQPVEIANATITHSP